MIRWLKINWIAFKVAMRESMYARAKGMSKEDAYRQGKTLGQLKATREVRKDEV